MLLLLRKALVRRPISLSAKQWLTHGTAETRHYSEIRLNLPMLTCENRMRRLRIVRLPTVASRCGQNRFAHKPKFFRLFRTNALKHHGKWFKISTLRRIITVDDTLLYQSLAHVETVCSICKDNLKLII